MSLSEQDEFLLNAYLDGQLAPIEATRFEQRLAGDPGLTAEFEAYRALRAAVRSDLSDDVPSTDLRRRIVARLNLTPQAGGRMWRDLAASFLLGAVLAGATSFAVFHDNSSADVARQIVSAHIRGLMAAQSTDVASSDHHTVKPWFNGKLAFAPTIADLGPQGFPLVGARIDVIGLEPVATLVYSRGKHLISLTEMPSTRATAAPIGQHVEHGYLALSWSEGKINYWAVSDAAADELQSFVRQFRAASAGL
jgi:anti-sigma factor RsiW